MINVPVDMNKYSIRDANLPPLVNEFSEAFTRCMITSLVDFYSGYGQILLVVESRDIIAFTTSIGLVRQTTLL